MAFAVEEATIESIQAALLAKELSVAELVGAYLERIERIDPQLNSIVTTSETALQRAKELESAPRGPLHGVPVVLKDNINTHDMPTAYGSVAMKGYRPPQDATVAHRLRDAGRGDHRQDDAAGLGDVVVQLLLADATRRATRTTPTATPAGRAPAPARRSPPTWPRSGWARTAAARSACPPRSATSSACAARPA